MANLHDNLKTNMAAIVNKAYFPPRKNINKNVICRPLPVRIGKNGALGLAYGPELAAVCVKILQCFFCSLFVECGSRQRSI